MRKGKIVIFGCGQTGKLFYKRMGKEFEVIGFSDNNNNIWDKTILCWEGVLLKCISPNEIPKDALVVIAAAPAFQGEIARQLENSGYKWETVDAIVFKRYKEKVDEILKECLTDLKSREIYNELLKCRAENEINGYIPLFEDNQYYAIPEFRFPGKRDKLFIDAGAFVGDSIEKYIYIHLGIIGKVCGIEPIIKQYKALEVRLERLRREWALDKEQLYSYNVAIGDNVGMVQIDMKDNIATSRVHQPESISNACMVQQVRLDDLFHDDVSMIKADIEGAELAMLRGGSKLIKQYKPRLAICLYHTPFDMLEIPLYIKALVPEYKMSIRHHAMDASETVLYCYL